MKWLIIITLLFFVEGHASSARLFVSLGSRCTFSVEELQEALDATIVEGGRHRVLEAVEELDINPKTRLLLLRNKICNMSTFARRLGYAHLRLNSCLPCAVKKVRSRLAKLPTTDKDLLRLDPKEVGMFYDLMKRVDRIFKSNKLTYWATCGTLLGAERHRGMIPWDDDMDVAIFENDVPHLLALKQELANEGLEIGFHPTFELYKIYPASGQEIFDSNGETYPWKYPFLDIFTLSELDGVYTYAAPFWRNNLKLIKRDYFRPEDLAGRLPELTFGPLKIPAPHNHIDYLNRMYGNDWKRVAYVMFSHRHEQFIPKIKVDLLNRSPPAYQLP